jgi:hypothetical protein
MTEEGTLSIVRRGTCYQVRYASNSPHDEERCPRVCPDEAHLAALLHHIGTELTVLPQVSTDVQQGKMVVLLVVVSAEQLQVFFPPIHVQSEHAMETRASGRPSSVRPPRDPARWDHARVAR